MVYFEYKYKYKYKYNIDLHHSLYISKPKFRVCCKFYSNRLLRQDHVSQIKILFKRSFNKSFSAMDSRTAVGSPSMEKNSFNTFLPQLINMSSFFGLSYAGDCYCLLLIFKIVAFFTISRVSRLLKNYSQLP